MAGLNRAFLRRAVLFLVDAGIRQFLDLGSGIPTVGNVHEVAQSTDPSCRVVYVDIEPVAVAHSELLLRDNERAAVIRGDLCEPDVILNDAVTRRLIDFGEPVGLLVVGVMQFIPDDSDPWGVLAYYRDALPAGSCLALSHFTPDGMPEQMAQAVEVFKHTQEPVHPRTRAEVLRMFGDFRLVDPGLVYTMEWRPECPEDVGEHPEHSNLYAAVGQKV
jgi:hypothetical protein